MHAGLDPEAIEALSLRHIQEFDDNAVTNFFIRWDGIEALGKRCFCPRDVATTSGEGVAMSDEGYVLSGDQERH
eukprot:12913694-Prorocentrum_lima.AAC.1